MNAHLAWLLGYSVFLIVLGVALGRLVKTTSSFFVAGRQLGPILLFATLLAANIGAGSTMGAASLGYTDGLAAWWWVGSAGIGTFFLAFWIGPRIHRVAVRHDLQTVGDYLELRYGASVRGAITALLWLGTLFILAGQLIAVAIILNAVAGVPHGIGCLIGGVVMTTYFAAGGLFTSAWVNLVQLVVLFGGFGIALPMSLQSVGGWDAVLRAGESAGDGYFNFWISSGAGLRLLPMLAPAFIISPGIVQKVYGARNEKAIRWGVGLCGLALLGFAFVPPLLGMVARVHHPDLANPGLALPAVFADELPLAFGSLGLAAVFSAELSSADAILFMLATSLSRDLYRRHVNPQATDRQVLAVARAAAVVGGGFGVVLAMALQTIVQALSIFYSILSVSLFIPVLFGLYSRRPGVPEALAAIGAGVTALLAVQFPTGGRGIMGLAPTFIGLVSAALAFLIVARVRERNRAKTDREKERG